jgi:hypothetical protein
MTMKKNTRSRGLVAIVLAAAALFVGCYAALANQQGYLNMSLARSEGPTVADPEIIVLVVDSGYQATLAEMLYLISKGKNSSLTPSEQDRLTTLGKQLATNGLVKFGGFPFFRADISGSLGTFTIPGIPAGRQYFVKIYEFSLGFTFDVKNIDQNFGKLIQYENAVFSNEQTTTSPTGGPTTPWQSWTLNPGQPVTVNTGQSASISVRLY